MRDLCGAVISKRQPGQIVFKYDYGQKRIKQKPVVGPSPSIAAIALARGIILDDQKPRAPSRNS
jgi:hypothetical protein